jgi:hypothetical protein
VGRVGERVGGIGISNGLSMVYLIKKINRATDTTKIMAQTKSSLVGVCARIGESRSTCRAMAAVISWLTLSKMYRLLIRFPL